MDNKDVEITKQTRVSSKRIQDALVLTFEQPFVVRGKPGNRTIAWVKGPSREEVWAFIALHFPVLAIEVMAKAFEASGLQLFDGHFLVPIPSWLFRQDFFHSPIADFPRLLSEGCDPNESDLEGLSPLEYALSARKVDRAIALVKAGASIQQCKIGGWLHSAAESLPAFREFLESLELAAALIPQEAGSQTIARRL